MAEPKRFYIYRVSVTRLDGTTRSAVVKTTSRERDPGASIYGLHAELARLQEIGAVKRATVTLPATVGPKQRERMQRWTATLPTLVGES
jgi:hypothetical protein